MSIIASGLVKGFLILFKFIYFIMSITTKSPHTFLIKLIDWENLRATNFDPSFDCELLNYDQDVTDLNYLLEVKTANEEATQCFIDHGFIELI